MWLALACLLAVMASWPAADAQGQLSTPPAQEYKLYFPQVGQPFRMFVPLFIPATSGPPASSAVQPRAMGAALPLPAVNAVNSPSGFVTRRGEDLQLDGRPYTFVGVNVSYLAGPFFPEDRAEQVIAYLAGVGVRVVRVWVEPWCDLERVERMLDLGRKYNLRFILTLQNFFGHEDGSWFRGDCEEDLRHIRNIVPRFASRPEVLMWELMNEPTCPSKDAGQDCWDALYRWAQVTSQEVKRLDPNHLVSVGTQRAGFYSLAIDAFRRVHALDSVDIVSVHGEVGKLAQGEFARELAIAHELGKPIYLGEVTTRGLQENCEPLPDNVLQRRAKAVAADIRQSLEAGIDGYLLWQYAYGRVDKGGQTEYFCGVFDYFAGDPVWEVIGSASEQK